MNKKIICFLMLYILLLPIKVDAHPHIWIDANLTVNFDKENEIVSITQAWIFDEVFSAGIIADYDKNKNGKLDKNEIKQVEKNAFSNVKNYNFYTHIFKNNEKQKITGYEKFSAKIENEKIIYYFTIPLDKSLNPFKSEINIGIYDGEYYVDIIYDENPFKSSGGKKKCSYSIFEDKAHPTYMGMVNPKTIKVCR